MSNYNYNTLCHHGIKGQKWGIRRYQNEDGTLTAEGRKRYGADENGNVTKEGLKLYKKDIKMQNIATKVRSNKSTGSKVALATVMGLSLGAAAAYTVGALEFLGDKTLSGKTAANLAGDMMSVPFATLGAGLGAIGGTIYDKVNKQRIQKAKDYINNIS